MPSVCEITRGCFNEIIELRKAKVASEADAQALHGRMHAAIEALYRGKHSQQLVDTVAFPIAATADGIALAKKGPMAAYWMANKLANGPRFREPAAGRQFFVKLDAHRRSGDLEILQVYHLCLAFGFQGDISPREVDNYAQDVRRSLGDHAKAGEMSPHGQRRGDRAANVRLGLIPVVAGLLAISFSLTLYFTLERRLAGKSEAIVEQVRVLSQSTPIPASVSADAAPRR